jgi:hypothetical protein
MDANQLKDSSYLEIQNIQFVFNFYIGLVNSKL